MFSFFPTIANGSISPSEEYGVLAAVDETQEDGRLANPFPDGDSVASIFNSPSDIFSRFITQLGPSMVRILYYPWLKFILTMLSRNP